MDRVSPAVSPRVVARILSTQNTRVTAGTLLAEVGEPAGAVIVPVKVAPLLVGFVSRPEARPRHRDATARRTTRARRIDSTSTRSTRARAGWGSRRAPRTVRWAPGRLVLRLRQDRRGRDLRGDHLGHRPGSRAGRQGSPGLPPDGRAQRPDRRRV